MVFVDILMGKTSMVATNLMSVIVLQIAQDIIGASDTLTKLQRTIIAGLFHQLCLLALVLIVLLNTIKTIRREPRMILLHTLFLVGRVMPKFKVLVV